MTEQQLDAEVSRYEPRDEPEAGVFVWSASEPDFDLPKMCFVGRVLFDQLTGGLVDRNHWRDYPTREAAFTDLRNAIRAAHA